MTTNVADNNIFLFKNQTGDGNGVAMQVPFPKGQAVVEAYGIFASGSVKIQTLAADNTTYIDAIDKYGNAISFSANGQKHMEYIIANQSLRGVQSGSTGTTNITLVLRKV